MNAACHSIPQTDRDPAPLAMAERVKAFNWSQTPLGPMDQWPPALRTAVDLCMNGPLPMFVWWGPELINIYNDAYATVLGRRHPDALGRPARELWAEIWPQIGDDVDGVMRGKAVLKKRQLLMLERNGYPEETYFTYSHSPIPDGNGGVGGLFQICTDETAAVLAERERDRQAEQRRQADERARTILESVTDAFFALDRDWKFTYVNTQAYKLLDKTPGTLLGQSLWEMYPGVLGSVFEPIYRDAMHNAADGMVTAYYPDHHRWYEVHTYPSPEGISVYFHNVTERHVAETALRESEARFRFLSDLGEQTRDLIDPEQVMETVARALGRHMGVSRCAYAEVEADSDQFTIRHDYTDGCASTTGNYSLSLFGPRAAADQRAGRTLVINDVDSELTLDQGAQMFNAIGIKAVICCPLVRASRLVAMMAVHQTTPRQWTAAEIALVEAVVERSWAYIERARTARALRDTDDYLRLAIDSSAGGFYGVDRDGIATVCNAAFMKMLGFKDTSEVIGRGLHDLIHHTRPDGTPYPSDACYIYRTARTGEPAHVDDELFFRTDGTSFPVEYWSLPIFRDGKACGAVTTFIDITEKKQFAEDRERVLESERAARTESERAGRMKDEFLATLSHELRTPLNAILGWSQIMRQTEDPDDITQGVDVIERNARAQAQIIEDLLDMSRIISGKVRLDVQRVDLSAVVRAAIETARPTAEAKGVRLQSVIDPLHGVAVTGDVNRLQQILWNLISNAIKFTPRGGRVQVLLERVNSHLEISVIDTGEGIRAEFLPFVFDRFRQSDASTTRRHGGLGLGLSIVKQLVELHGGSILVKSAGEGMGSSFIVSLPLTVIHSEANHTSGRRHPSADGSHKAMPDLCAEIAGVRVLVVDDEPDARTLVSRLLEDCNAVVTATGSVSEAIELIRTGQFDVLVSDIGMPGEDGYSLIRRVRSLAKHQGGEVPAVALTAYARAEDRVKAVSAGFQMHVAKPVEPIELVTMIAGAAGRLGRPQE